jgi:hypothetical protein
VTSMSGRAGDARRELAAIERSPQDAEAGAWDLERFIAEAWACAAEGATSQAISILRDAAADESERGRSAWEVMLLQVATQFGDHTTAARLTELAGLVQGPRAPACRGSRCRTCGGKRGRTRRCVTPIRGIRRSHRRHRPAAGRRMSRGPDSCVAGRGNAAVVHCASARDHNACRTRVVEQGSRRPAHDVGPLRRRAPLPRLSTGRSQQPRRADLHSARALSNGGEVERQPALRRILKRTKLR